MREQAIDGLQGGLNVLPRLALPFFCSPPFVEFCLTSGCFSRSRGNGLLLLDTGLDLVRFGLRFGSSGSNGLPGADGGAEDERNSDHGGGCQRDLVPPREFAEAIDGGRR